MAVTPAARNGALEQEAGATDEASASPYTPLFRRVFATNAAVLALAGVITVFVFSPGPIDPPVAFKQLAIFAGTVGVMLFVNLLLIRRTTVPLERLMALMRRVDLLKPGERALIVGDASEATELAYTFNEMLDRLEAEREESTRRALAAQESERVRIARELHDEIGQGLTAGLLQLGRIRREAPAYLEEDLVKAQDTVRSNLDELRRIAQRLRPEALDQLGLVSALTSFSERIAEQAGLDLRRELARELPPLSYEEELVIYRIAQEALTNVVRHADARYVELSLLGSDHGRGVSLGVIDDGRGLARVAQAGGGIRGMYERALLIDAELDVRAPPPGGTEVRLDVTVADRTL